MWAELVLSRVREGEPIPSLSPRFWWCAGNLGVLRLIEASLISTFTFHMAVFL